MKFPLLLCLNILTLDQFSKILLLDWYASAPPPHEILPFFNLVLVWNQGISFGMLNGADARWALVGMTSLLIVFLAVWMGRAADTLTRLAVALVMGGAIGNLIDRLRFGAVVDFLDFHIGDWHWPAFNVADSCIVIGVSMLVLTSLRKPV